MIFTVLVLLIGKAEALTLTQKLGNEYIVTTVEQGDEVEMTFTSKVGFKFKNWVVSGVSGVDTTRETINFTIGSSNVTVEGKYIEKYTVTYNANGGEGSMSNQSIPALSSKNLTQNAFTRENYNFLGWAESANGTKKYDDGQNITPTKDLNLYALWEESVVETYPIKDIPVGAYVKYDLSSNPTVTVLGTDSGLGSGDSNNQYFYPSQYENGWKVMYNNNGQLDIVSAESVGDLKLQGADGYARAVYTLNTLCSGYVNDLATSGRSLGSTKNWLNETVTKDTADSTKSAGIIDTSDSQYPLTHANTYTNGNKGYPYNDELYKQAMPVDSSGYLISELRHTSGNVWLASRCLSTSSSSSIFGMRYVTTSGGVNNLSVYGAGSSGSTNPYSNSRGVRPVISLDSGLKVISGPECDGSTLEKAYVLSR